MKIQPIFDFFPNSALGLYLKQNLLSLGVTSHFNDTCFHWHKLFRELRKNCAFVFRLCGACCLGGVEKDRIEFQKKLSLADFSSIQPARWVARLPFFVLLKKQRSNHQRLLLQKNEKLLLLPFGTFQWSFDLSWERGFSYIFWGRFDAN